MAATFAWLSHGFRFNRSQGGGAIYWLARGMVFDGHLGCKLGESLPVQTPGAAAWPPGCFIRPRLAQTETDVRIAALKIVRSQGKRKSNIPSISFCTLCNDKAAPVKHISNRSSSVIHPEPITDRPRPRNSSARRSAISLDGTLFITAQVSPILIWSDNCLIFCATSIESLEASTTTTTQSVPVSTPLPKCSDTGLHIDQGDFIPFKMQLVKKRPAHDTHRAGTSLQGHVDLADRDETDFIQALYEPAGNLRTEIDRVNTFTLCSGIPCLILASISFSMAALPPTKSMRGSGGSLKPSIQQPGFESSESITSGLIALVLNPSDSSAVRTLLPLPPFPHTAIFFIVPLIC